MEHFNTLITVLCKLPDETGWLEFMHNNDEPHMIDENISVLDNF